MKSYEELRKETIEAIKEFHMYYNDHKPSEIDSIIETKSEI